MMYYCIVILLSNLTKNKNTVERLVLKQEVLDRIKNDPELYGAVAKAIGPDGVSPLSLPKLLYANDPKLTQATVLRILRERLGVEQDNELLVVVQEEEPQNA